MIIKGLIFCNLNYKICCIDQIVKRLKLLQILEQLKNKLLMNCYPSQRSSVGSISAWYWGGPGFKSRQRREFFNENK